MVKEKEILAIEQKVLEKTIKNIKDYTYYLAKTIDHKTSQLRTKNSMTGDFETYRNTLYYKELMQRVAKAPYFGSFEIMTETDGHEKFYIGKHGVHDKDENIIVLDWRMPMARVFYNFTPENPTQEVKLDEGAETTKFTVNILKKLDYTILNQKVKKVIQQVSGLAGEEDMAISDQGEELLIRDEFLRKIVENRETTGYLKDIILTIQKEQDKAIREPLRKNLIVQGVAGSGKSSIAMHRLSYLLFNNKLIKPEDMLVIGPSKLFISSVKELLPELDIEQVGQLTVNELLLSLFSNGQLENSAYDKDIKQYFEECLFENKKGTLGKMIELKGSKQFVNLLDRFLEAYTANYVNRFNRIKVFERIIEKDELVEIYQGYQYLPFYDRVNKFIQHVKNIFKQKKDELVSMVEEQAEDVKKFFKDEKSGLGEQELKIYLSGIGKTKKNRVDNLEAELKSKMRELESKLKVDDAFSLYKQFLSKEMIQELTEDQDIINLVHHYRFKQADYFDLAPLCYIHLSLNKVNKKYVHLVIDEGQDLSFAHYAVLKKITKTMTILGDKDQSIYMGYGQTNWNELTNQMFDGQDVTKLTLETSYRTTTQIIEAANKVLSNNLGMLHIPITSLAREGNKVNVTEIKDGRDLTDNIVHVLKDWQKKYNRVAVIHKTEEKSRTFAKLLQKSLGKDVAYVDPEQEIKKHKISVLTSYNSKGMEFDAVILVNVNEESFPNDELHSRLLYVLMTRAQHEVRIFYNGEPSPLLEGIMDEKPAKENQSIYDMIL